MSNKSTSKFNNFARDFFLAIWKVSRDWSIFALSSGTCLRSGEALVFSQWIKRRIYATFVEYGLIPHKHRTCRQRLNRIATNTHTTDDTHTHTLTCISPMCIELKAAYIFFATLWAAGAPSLRAVPCRARRGAEPEGNGSRCGWVGQDLSFSEGNAKRHTGAENNLISPKSSFG